MAATVTGAFIVLDRASRPIRRIRDEAIKADLAVKSLGSNLDKIGTSQQRNMMQDTMSHIRRLGGEAHTASQETGVLADRLDKAGAPQVARNLATQADAIQQTRRAAQAATPEMGRLATGTRRVQVETRGARQELALFGGMLRGLRSGLAAGLIPMIGLAAQGIGALGAGVTALLPKFGSLTALAAPAGTAIVGIGLAAVTTKFAFHNLSQAMGGNAKAMQSLTPEAKSFIRVLQQYKPVMNELRASAQRGLFPGLELAIRRMNRMVPIARSLLQGIGQRVGGLAADAAQQFTRPGFMRDFEILGNEGGRAVDRLGHGVINLIHAFKDFLIVGAPFTRWLTDTVLGWTESVRGAAALGRETGTLSAWYDRARDSLTTMGSVAKNVWSAVGGILHAASQQGDGLWHSIDRITGRWADWANSAHGQHDMRQYFQDMRAPLSAVVGFFGDLIKGLGRLSTGSGFTQAMEALRAALPGLTSALNTLAGGLGVQLVTMLGNVLTLVSSLVGGAGGGPLVMVLKMLNGVLSSVNGLVQRVPALGGVLAAAFTVLAVRKFGDALIVLTKRWMGVAGAAGTAAAAQAEALGMGAAAAGGGGLVAMGRGARGAPSSSVGYGRPAGAGMGAMNQQLALFGGASAATTAGAARFGVPAAAQVEGPMAARGLGLGGLGVTAAAGAIAARRALPGMAMRGIGAVGRFAWPVAAFGGALGAMQGTGGQGASGLAQNIGAGATLGLLPGVQTGDALHRQAFERAQHQFGLAPVTGPGIAARRRQVQARLSDALAHSTPGPGVTVGGVRVIDRGGGLLGTGGGPTRDEARRNAEGVKAYRIQLQQLNEAEANLHRQSVVRARTGGQNVAIGLGEAFNIYNRRYGLHKAMRETTADTIGQLKKLGPVGRMAMGQSMLDWAHEQARQNPKLWGQVHSLENQIKSAFDRMGKHVSIVNGTILTGSRGQWKQISDAMQDPMAVARAKISEDLTRIQQTAVGALKMMGFSPNEARALIRGSETPAGQRNLNTATSLIKGTPGQRQAAKNIPGAVSMGSKRARGGRLPGFGLHDTVPMADGGFGAPGELVVNRHTEHKIDRLLGRYGAMEGLVRGERTPHSAPMYATGNRLGQSRDAPPQARMGALGGLQPGIMGIAQAVLAANPGLVVTSTTGGRHAAGSYHYRGMAVDLAGGNMNRAAAWVGANVGGSLLEGIHNPNLSIKNGRRVSPSFWGATTWAGHGNHIHLAASGGGRMRGLGGFGGGAGGGAAQHIALGRMGMGVGVPGAMRGAAYNAMAAGMEARINQQLGGLGGGVGTGGLSGGTSGQNQRIGRQMMLAAGWGASQWPALKALWTKESGWNANAVNKSSGAYGIPQALGHGHPFNLGDARGQIAWGLNYIRGRYGSPAAAWAHEQSANWYGMGGRIPGWGGWHQRGGTGRFRRPTLIGVGDGMNPEDVSITPHEHKAGGGGGGKRGSVVLNFHPGSIVIQGHGRDAAEQLVEHVLSKVTEALDGMGLESEAEMA